jgi:hypothetical protein
MSLRLRLSFGLRPSLALWASFIVGNSIEQSARAFNTRCAFVINTSRVGEFLLITPVIPAKAGHEVKLLRYPEGNQLRALDPRLRGDDAKNTPMAEIPP